MSFQEFLEFSFLNMGDFHLSLWKVIVATLILLLARLFVAIITKFIRRYSQKRKLDHGRHYAFQQFAKYIIYTSALLMALEAIGIQLSVVWGGAAALMVGIGLGLQQTFNDLISGLILLIEATVEVGDVIEVNGLVGTVTDIGIRTSKIITRDRISIIVPNSKLIGDNAVNWSHDPQPTRFQVYVGVAYSSDIDLVTKLLLKAAHEHQGVLNTPKPTVQFKDFGNSSLDFVLHIFSEDYLGIEFVKSDLRYKITQLFREHKVEIPFPQQDIWLRNGEG